MMNLVALGLLFSSLAAAGVWSPNPPEARPREEQHPPPPRDIGQSFREGHRLLVVEYERQVAADAGERAALSATTQHLVEESKERLKEAASVLPNVGQGLATPLAPPGREPHAAGGAKNVICDAYGVCKEVVAGLAGRAKEKTSEKTSEMEAAAKEAIKKAGEKAAELKEGAEEAVKEASGRAEQLKETAKEAVRETASKAKDKVESAMDQASQIKEGVKDKMGSAMDQASQVKEGAKQAVEKITEKTKEAGENLAGNISGVAKAEHKAEKISTEVRGNLTDILRRANEVACDVVAYAWSPETAKAVAAILHLLGFATAYGACVWVTFASSNVLAAALPRQQFGLVQSKLYPVYFQVVAYATATALVAHLAARDRRILAEGVQAYNLLFALVMVLINMLFLEPKATKVMFERMKVEKEEGRGRDMADVISEPAVASTLSATTKTTTTTTTTTKVAVEQDVVKSGEMVRLNMRLKRLNSYSSFLNILTLMSLSWHLVHLSRQMQVGC